MLMSMTGFSTHTSNLVIQGTPVTLTMSLKSVNGRYLEVSCKLPYGLANLETACIKIFKQRLIRGTVYFTVYVSHPGAFKSPPKPAHQLIESYITALHDVQKKYNLPGTITINDIVSLPYVFETAEETLDEATIQQFLSELNPLINSLLAEREREGSALAVDLRERVARLRQIMQVIAPRAKEIMEQRKDQLLASIQPILQNATEESKEQHRKEIYIQLEKMDIHEEIVRFTTHLDQFETILNNGDQEKGKRLDFTLQELFREINTMAAKCNDASISSSTIAMKVEVEKAREQVQNIV